MISWVILYQPHRLFNIEWDESMRWTERNWIGSSHEGTEEKCEKPVGSKHTGQNGYLVSPYCKSEVLLLETTYLVCSWCGDLIVVEHKITIQRRIRKVVHVACMGEIRNAYRILVWKPEGKRQLGRHRNGWENNIKMDVRWNGKAWTGFICQDRDHWWLIWMW